MKRQKIDAELVHNGVVIGKARITYNPRYIKVKEEDKVRSLSLQFLIDAIKLHCEQRSKKRLTRALESLHERGVETISHFLCFPPDKLLLYLEKCGEKCIEDLRDVLRNRLNSDFGDSKDFYTVQAHIDNKKPYFVFTPKK